MDEKNPALIASRNSWRCVMSKDRDGWLALMADDITIEDPIGEAPTNPTGEGLKGKDAVLGFWAQNIEPTTIKIEPQESFASGLEAAHVLTLTTTFENGMSAQVHGIFTYRVNDDGKLTNLRGYWSLDDMKMLEAK